MNIKKTIIWSIIIAILFILPPAGLYIYKFHKYILSDNPADWGTFGDYIGGVIGTCFNLLATVLALGSIYISLKISKKVQENEINFNNDNIKREEEKFKREEALLHKQYRPFPYVFSSKHKDASKITLENHGAGPMIVGNIKLTYKDESYPSFHKFLQAKKDVSWAGLYYYYDTSSVHVLTPGSSKILLDVKPKGELSPEFTESQKIVRSLLKDCVLKFEYEDLFENKKPYTAKMNFFGD
jgi:hypothetical protein